MSKGKGHQSQQSQATSQSQQSLDPQVMSALQGNWQDAQKRLGNLQYKPISGADIQGFQNPYTSQVVDTTNNQMEQARQQAIQSGHATAVGQNAFGGSRTGVLDALTNKDYLGQMAATDASLNSAGYNSALSAAQTQNSQQNQWPLLIQAALNGSLGLMGNPVLGSSSGQSSGSGSGWTMNVDASKLFAGAGG